MAKTLSDQATIKLEKLDEAAKRAKTCLRCELATTRNKVVYGEGNPTAPLVFVGEGPGQMEDLTGRPFVGRAGALLDECLRESGMTRKHVYICNIVKCRACLIDGGKVRNRPPRIEETEACFPWLEEQLEIIKPLVIVCLGVPAANSLIHSNFRITNERGQWFTPSRFARYIMAALHPAFILRQEGDAYEMGRKALAGDINSARRKVIEARREPSPTLFDL